MASGWAPDSAVQDQIDSTVADAVEKARAGLRAGLVVGVSESHCAECGDEIPEARRRAVPGVRRCVECQGARDARPVLAGINRRGSKDSQLR